MATQQFGRQIGGRFAIDGRMMGCGLALVVLAVVLVAALVWRPQAAPLRAAQPVVGQALTVIVPVWDGTTYRNAPVQVSTLPRVVQPVIGRVMTVTAPVWDGTTYRNVPIQVGTPLAAQPVVGQAMVVTAPVWDGTDYQSMPVRMGNQ